MANIYASKTEGVVIDPMSGTTANLDKYKNTSWEYDQEWKPNTDVFGAEQTLAEAGRRNIANSTEKRVQQTEKYGTKVAAIEEAVLNGNRQAVIASKSADGEVSNEVIDYYTTANATGTEGTTDGSRLNKSFREEISENNDVGKFDTRMNLITTSDSQMTYRKAVETDVENWMNMNPDKWYIAQEISQATAYSEENKVREMGVGTFNRGNDITEGVDRQTSRTLDISMFMNNKKTDILGMRGGSGVKDNSGEYTE